ncbi:hypothetical protein XENTR_v10009353 [Xenopus tropicalis]|uniref:Synemin n=1 Tax=Xenopus tropicalis TaxID=8364 RepID=A0A6I8SEV3_XENTR|nr:synemin [Xenopus tropicalis]KAE8618317.1 hypothetical protein XENTR_v10009353 [Xenopus tropicalis]
MLSIRRTFAEEKSELRELNSRLDQYLSRVRQLESENQLLVEEIQRLRVERGREWAHGYEAEITELRRKVEEITVEKCEAELQRENLWQELQSLQELWDQVKTMRLRIDQQLAQYKQDLQQAMKGQVALEELYNCLLQECHMLRGSQHEELVALRDQAICVPLTVSMQETVHPRLSLQDVQSFSLELSESWKETFLLYQKKIEELESYVILSERSRREAEEEARAQGAHVVELRREYEELMGMRKVLEEELLKMKEKYRLEMEEYQIIIEELEQEKQTVTVTITDRLQDYHELMKLKTGLSLEVAAYRALLEAESNKGTITWFDQSVLNRPAGYITPYFDQAQRYSGIKREKERKDLPVNRTNKEIRTTQTSNVQQFQSQKVPQIRINALPIDTGRTSRFYTSQDKSSGWGKNLSPRYEFTKNKDISKTIKSPDRSSFIKSQSSIHSESVTQRIKQEQSNFPRPSIIKKPQAVEIHKGQINATLGSKTKETRSLNTLESKLVDEKKLVDKSKVTTKTTEEEKCRLDFNIPIIGQREVKSVVTSVTESIENNEILEPKIQEPPVKKERMKNEQAKMRNEELEKKEAVDRNTAYRENLGASCSVQKKNIYIFREKPESEEAVLEIPIQSEARKREENQHKSSIDGTGETYVDEEAPYHRNIKVHTSLTEGVEQVKIGEPGEDITSAEHLTKNSVVEGILKHFGQSSGLDDANVTYVEKKEQGIDGSVKTKIFVQTKTKEEVDVFDEPDLTDIWNSSSYQKVQEGITRAATIVAENEEAQKPKETKIIMGEGKGVEDLIENIIQNELKGRSGISFNVEIIEESTGSFVTEKPDFSTPFHVEEAEDNIQITESACVDDKPQDPLKAEDLQSKTQVQSHVEEVTEGGDEDEETNYFVSVPDDTPLVQDEEQETLRGQIHTEDSHVKYSWQDEFLQGSQGQKALSEFLRYAGSSESETIVHDILDDDREHRTETQPKTETIVIEKEIKIPHEFQSSIIGLFSKDIKDPQQQLKGTLECLQGSLPQDIVAELSALTGEQQGQDSSLAVDIKKVEQPTDTSMVTIVAEINLSQTIDADTLDTQRLLGDSMSEDVATLLGKTKGDYSLLMNEFATNEKPGHPISSESNKEGSSYISKDNTDKATNESFSTNVELPYKQTSTDSRFIKHIKLETSEHINQAEFVSDTKEQAIEDNISPISTNRSVHHITFGPKEIPFDEKNIFEGPMSETLGLDTSKGSEDSSDYSRPIRHIKLSPSETYTVEQIVFEGPIFHNVSSSGSTEDFTFGELNRDSTSQKNVHDNTVETEDPWTVSEESNNKSIYQTETIAGGIKTITHYTLNSRDPQMTKEIVIEGDMPKVQLLQETDNLEENTMPTEHRTGSHKIHIAKQVKHQGFVSEPYKLADSGKLVEEEEKPNINTLVHHIKLSPNREQIVFEGPVSSNVHISTQESSTQMQEENRSITHIIIGDKGAQTSESVIFEGPASETYESCDLQVSSPSGESGESERSIRHIKLGPTEKSFTFQMDITQIATKYQAKGDDQEREIVITSSNFETQPGTSQPCSELTDDLEVTESGYGEEDTSGVSQYEAEIQSHSLSLIETPTFEKTVHVQRIAQQSSLVSDDKKVAIVYLDEEEEPGQDYLRRSF